MSGMALNNFATIAMTLPFRSMVCHLQGFVIGLFSIQGALGYYSSRKENQLAHRHMFSVNCVWNLNKSLNDIHVLDPGHLS